MSRKTNKQGVINRDANATNRAMMAVQLRAQRLTFDEIANRCGYASPGAARNAIQRELQRTVVSNVEEMRAEELDVLNRLHAAIWSMVVFEETEDVDEKGRKKKPSLFAVDRLLAISERRSRLMGLDVPTNSNTINAAQVVIREVPAGLLPEVLL